MQKAAIDIGVAQEAENPGDGCSPKGELACDGAAKVAEVPSGSQTQVAQKPGDGPSQDGKVRGDGQSQKAEIPSDGPAPQTQPPKELSDLDDVAMDNILRHLDVFDLASLASTSKLMKHHAESAFRRKKRLIEIDDSRRTADLREMLLQFGHLVESISIGGTAVYILEVLAVIGSRQGYPSLKRLQLTSFQFDTEGSSVWFNL